MDIHEWPCRIRSARQKRRSVIADRDKRLIQLDKRRDELRIKRRELPPEPLAEPYQKGWKRFFVLRDDVKHSPRAEFYTELLTKINTVEYHHDKTFKRRKRRKRRYHYHVKPQQLRELSEYSWNGNRLNLTEQEQACFTAVEVFDTRTKRNELKYVFSEPWRYVLKVAPYMVTHRQALDAEIETEIAHIRDQIRGNFLEPRIGRLTHGRSNRWWRADYFEPGKYINRIKNMPLYLSYDEYLDVN